jgi:hypothetical protein
MIAAAFLILLGFYLLLGIIFAVPFVLFGVQRIDPHAGSASWGFRLLMVPGAMTLWPLLLRRWTGGVHEPPPESNSHRRFAQSETGRSSPVTRHPL